MPTDRATAQPFSAGDDGRVTLLTFSLEQHRFAVFADLVRELVRAATPTPLPRAPEAVLGVLDLRGTPLPVYDVRRRFGLGARELRLSDVFLVLTAGPRLAAFAVDAVHGLVEIPRGSLSAVRAGETPLRDVAGVAHLEDGSAVVYDLDAFLSDVEQAELTSALAAEAKGVV